MTRGTDDLEHTLIPDVCQALRDEAGSSREPDVPFGRGGAANDPGIRGVIGIYPPTDLRRTWDVSTGPPRAGRATHGAPHPAGVPHAMVCLPWAAHGFDLIGFDTPGGQAATYAVEYFLSAVTR